MKCFKLTVFHKQMFQREYDEAEVMLVPSCSSDHPFTLSTTLVLLKEEAH